MSEMSEMVERVVDAMVFADHGSDPGLSDYEGMARAAIKAMREPTRPMIDAAWCSTTICGDHPKGALSHKTKTKNRWRAMIDAALGTLTSDADQTQPRPE